MTREEAIKWLENLKEDIGHPRHEALWHYEQALDEIIQAVTQKPKTREWIPCSERLPENDEPHEVLCCDVHGNQLIAYPFACEEANTGYCAESDECYLYDCIAWMPLPEPYKGGDEMTREEAIKWLENLKEDIGHPRHEALWHYEQALDEIIQTLTQEPKTDKE